MSTAAAGASILSEPDCGDRELFTSRPLYGLPRRPVLPCTPGAARAGADQHERLPLPAGIPVAKGQRLKMTANYDNRYAAHARDGDHGRVLRPDAGVTNGCGAAAAAPAARLDRPGRARAARVQGPACAKAAWPAAHARKPFDDPRSRQLLRQGAHPRPRAARRCAGSSRQRSCTTSRWRPGLAASRPRISTVAGLPPEARGARAPTASTARCTRPEMTQEIRVGTEAPLGMCERSHGAPRRDAVVAGVPFVGPGAGGAARGARDAGLDPDAIEVREIDDERRRRARSSSARPRSGSTARTSSRPRRTSRSG